MIDIYILSPIQVLPNCKIAQKSGPLVTELKKEILSKAAIYKKQNKDKNFKENKG